MCFTVKESSKDFFVVMFYLPTLIENQTFYRYLDRIYRAF